MPENYYRPRGPFTRRPGRLAENALAKANNNAWLAYARKIECKCCNRTADQTDGTWYQGSARGAEFVCDGHVCFVDDTTCRECSSAPFVTTPIR